MYLNTGRQDGNIDSSGENMQIFRSILFRGLLFLIMLNIIIIEMRYFLPKGNYTGFERWVGLILIVAALLYVCLSFWKFPEHADKIRSLCRRLFCREQIILTAMFLWYLIDCLIYQCIGFEECFKKNDYYLYLTGLVALGFFPLAEYAGPKRVRAVMEGIIHMVVAQYTVYSAWCLWHYLQLDYIAFPSGKLLEMGAGYSLKMGNNRNIVGTAAGVMISLCVYMILTQKPLIKGAYVLQALINMTVLLLSNCRSGLFGVIAVLAISISAACWKKLSVNKILIRAAICLLMALICFAVMRTAQKALFHYLNNKMAEVEAVLVETQTDAEADGEVSQNPARSNVTKQAEEDVQVNSVIKERNLTNSGLNGRKKVWKRSLQLIFLSPRNFMIGVTPGLLKNAYKKAFDLKKGPDHTHNLYLQIAASLGVPTMLLFVVFLFSLGKRCIRLLLAGKQAPFEGAWSIQIILLYMILIDLVEPMLFASGCVNLPFFYLLAGWIVAMDKRCLKKKDVRTPLKDK